MLAALCAATFAFNNASARRGVLTGSVAQALAITVPIGVPMFLAAVIATGNLGALSHFSEPGARPPGAGRRAAFRGGTLRQFPCRPGDRRQPLGPGDPAQPRRYPGAGGAGAEGADDSAAHLGDRVARAGARAHAQRLCRDARPARPAGAGVQAALRRRLRLFDHGGPGLRGLAAADPARGHRRRPRHRRGRRPGVIRRRHRDDRAAPAVARPVASCACGHARNRGSGSPIPASRSASPRCSSTWPTRSRRFRW